MKIWKLYEKSVNLIAELMGRIGWLLLLYCMFFGVVDVFLRYVLNSPSLWISTTVQVAMVFMACVGGVYAYNADAFVKLDLFYANFSPRKKALCDLVTVILTLAFLAVVIWKGMDAALLSVKMNQMTPTSVPIPVYPMKIFIPIAAVVMLLVVIKKIIQDIIILVTEKKTSPIHQ
ncbi:MAG: TRAP transporter small permease subunit [Gammaproteobacteria bacterium]|nr:TRAP transporter small permease subunit [Gammaproteobacteria bacterium]